MLYSVEKAEHRPERLKIMLPIRVEAHESAQAIWRELTNLESVSHTGADFYLTRLFTIGQLLYLSMPIDKELRRYDQEKENYCVWSIIRHCHRVIRKNSSVFHLEVGFIGPEPPAGYRKNPSSVYQLGQIDHDGFWQVHEEPPKPPNRKEQRYTIPIEIFIGICDDQGNILTHERTVTENISEHGAAVFSDLDVKVGDRVKFVKQYGGFSATAVVRARRVGKDNLPRLHLEFINIRFPLDGIG
ncbi:MAG: PilZ domain-containing protein [Acidobacteria bacterium]|nr:PilZ domain-containing protein [Acidobacteriota bacterium]